jgi:methyl-accepting chemotaxis protein
MTDDELRTLVASNAEATRELRATVEKQAQQSENQGRAMTEGLVSLQASSESQLRSIESMRENISYNTDIMANALELAAISQRTAAAAQESAAASQQLAAAALELSANTSRNLDRQEQDTAELKQMIGILIRDNQADRVRFSRLEGQN